MNDFEKFLLLFLLLFVFLPATQIDIDEWKPFFEGNLTEAVIFPNGEEGEVLLGYEKNCLRIVREREGFFIFNSSLLQFQAVEEKELFLFLDEDLAVSGLEDSSWKVLVFPDENKFIVYRKR
ncbi:MAG: hypothetical protein KAQ64_02150 [Candidatus Pacebacteria bacterium]|nr:hypothetical protein [Candidatus Paceibacterota bacterium]